MRDHSPSVQDRSSMYHLRPPTQSRFLRGMHVRVTTLPVSQEEAKHASLPSVHAVSRWLWSIQAR